MGKLDGKVAIITGGTSGIGAGSAIKFAEEGAKVVIVGRNKQRGADVVKQIEEVGSEGIFVKADMGVVADADKIVKAAIDKFGKLDVLFSNAGMIVNVPFLDHTEEMYDEVMTVDLKMPFVLT